jgi:hypothetical protein
VVVRVSEKDVPSRMEDMRVWLDARHFEPLTFKLQTSGSTRVLEVKFKYRYEAEAFAAQFAGRLTVA